MNTTYVIDFDSTIVNCETLDELARIALSNRPDSAKIMHDLEELTNLGMAGKLPFDESLKRRLQLFKASKSQINQLVELLLGSITPSVLSNKQWFIKNSKDIYIVSGGFTECIAPIAKIIGIPKDHILANNFVFDGQFITGVDNSKLTSQAGGKIKQVLALNLTDRVVIIGDGYTDYEVKNAGAADEFWAFTEHVSRPNVVAVADKVLTSFYDVIKA